MQKKLLNVKCPLRFCLRLGYIYTDTHSHIYIDVKRRVIHGIFDAEAMFLDILP